MVKETQEVKETTMETMGNGQIFTEAPEEGTWIPFFGSSVDSESGKITYDDPITNAAEFCIRSTKKFYEERMKSRKLESGMTLNPKTRGMEKVTSFKEQSPAELIEEYNEALDYSITGIRNAFWDKSTPIKCTKEDKMRLKNISVFDRFLARAIEMLDEGAVKQVEAVEKN